MEADNHDKTTVICFKLGPESTKANWSRRPSRKCLQNILRTNSFKDSFDLGTVGHVYAKINHN